MAFIPFVITAFVSRFARFILVAKLARMGRGEIRREIDVNLLKSWLECGCSGCDCLSYFKITGWPFL